MIIKKISAFKEQRKARKRMMRNKDIISGSDLFDEVWYLKQYPEVKNYRSPPLEHYIELGAAEGRAAGPRFDTLAYITANPDVAEAGHNPLVHYIRHGEKEGRKFALKSIMNLSSAKSKLRQSTTFSIILGPGINESVDNTLSSLHRQTGFFFEVIYDSRLELGAPQKSRKNTSSGFSRYVPVSGSDNSSFLYRAASVATYDFTIYLNSGDTLDPSALQKLSRSINTTNCDLVYSDESQSTLSIDGTKSILKPSWSPELLLAYDYFGHLTAIRTCLLKNIISHSNDMSQSLSIAAAQWDLHLRVTEQTNKVERVANILCHRIQIDDKDLRLPASSDIDYDEVLKAAWKRRGHTATVSRSSDGTFRSSWTLSAHPLVSIVIPNRNRAHLLRTCTNGIFNRTAYKNVEIIVVDNKSDDFHTIELYRELSENGVRIIYFNEPFNYSRACNKGAVAARGEFLLFLNNDVEIVQADWLEQLVRAACEPGVGVVGAKLLYPSGEIQHAGVAIGLFSLAAHVFHRTPHNLWGPFGSPDTQRNLSAVTGACQLVRRTLFDLVSGYDEEFIIAYSDVLFCLDVARMGFRTVYLPSAILVHHEGASRGTESPQRDQILFAKRLRSLGFAADPYFHPALDPESFEPKVLRTNTAVSRTRLQADIETIAGPPAQPLNPYDFGAIATAVGMSWDAIMWPFDPVLMEPSLENGTRIILEFLWRRSDLRKQFPRPIRDGSQGGFALWIKTDGLRLLGLSTTYVRCIDAAFASDIGGKSRQILAQDHAFCNDNPLYLLPEGRNASCARLFDAYVDGLITREDIWWFLFSLEESPHAALCETWASTPSWQAAIPDGGTVFGIIPLAQWVWDLHGVRDQRIFVQEYPSTMSDAAQVRVAYAARPEWQKCFPMAMTDESSARALLDHLATHASGLSFLPRGWVEARRKGTLAKDIVAHGINILGHFAYPSGLRISTESLVEGLRENGIAASLRNVPVSTATDDPTGHHFQGLEFYDTTLIHVQPEPLFDEVYKLAGLLPRHEKTYRIGYWYWEFGEVPESWNRASLQCDEIWTATKFIADGLRRHYRQPIYVLTPGIEMPVFDRMPRNRFQIPDDEFVFVFVFHMTSIMDRKNPLGLIEAFKQAFNSTDKARLVIKTSFGAGYPKSMDALKTAAEESKIDIIDAVFTRDETLSLIDCGDAYVSLHRSEGLGLTMAEAMLLGKPVIATRYSGNCEFMDDNNSLLVDYEEVQLDRDIDPYKAGLRWAEPSIEHAAVLMRKLYEQPEIARAVGARAKDDLERRLSYSTTGRAVAERLGEINAMKCST
ncbi:glycosyltransferase [Methylobacterium sp. HMF5984]|uniref:glycosyltransferase n=1 Tax=Methylobacterium sp. HMF5984 TaxID=3367370 RepID=UPI003852169F